MRSQAWSRTITVAAVGRAYPSAGTVRALTITKPRELFAAPADAYVERVCTFATGTPVANSLAELWVMQTYLRPDLLDHAGVEPIDAWGQNFTDTTETVELNASGTKLRSVTRVGQFANVGDLVGMVAQFTDAVTRDQVPVDLPVGVSVGARQTYTMAASAGEISVRRTDANASAIVASGGRITGSVVMRPPAVSSS